MSKTEAFLLALFLGAVAFIGYVEAKPIGKTNKQQQAFEAANPGSEVLINHEKQRLVKTKSGDLFIVTERGAQWIGKS